MLWHWFLLGHLPQQPVGHLQMQPGGLFAAVIAGWSQASSVQRQVMVLNGGFLMCSGSCGNACPTDPSAITICSQGTCIFQCTGGTTQCGTVLAPFCTDTTSDNLNCGEHASASAAGIAPRALSCVHTDGRGAFTPAMCLLLMTVLSSPSAELAKAAEAEGSQL
jgi:hypothetical protein